MRDYVGDPNFLLQKRFERKIEELYPEIYKPLYSQVTFSHIRYSEALKKGKEQEEYIKSIMKKHDIAKHFELDTIDTFIHSIYAQKKEYDVG